MTTDTPRTEPSDDEPSLDPRLEDEVTPDLLDGADDDSDNPGEPTPGSDNDGPEAGYTPPDELPPRSPEPPD